MIIDTEVMDAIEYQPHLETRALPFKWIIAVNGQLGRGLLANATACLAAAVGKAAPAIVGADVKDRSGSLHSGLPWPGCTIVETDAVGVRRIRTAAAEGGLAIADMTSIAQRASAYADYLDALADARADEIIYYAVSVLGPKKSVNRLIGQLPLLR
jgi:hypothetical protein